MITIYIPWLLHYFPFISPPSKTASVYTFLKIFLLFFYFNQTESSTASGKFCEGASSEAEMGARDEQKYHSGVHKTSSHFAILCPDRR